MEKQQHPCPSVLSQMLEQGIWLRVFAGHFIVKPGVLVHTSNPRAWEVEAGSEVKARLGFTKQDPVR